MKEYHKRAKVLQAMAHPARLQVLETLACGPACVCELVWKTRRRQANVSQHLMLLRQAGLVKATRQGKNMQYKLAQPEITSNLLKCLSQTDPSKISKQG